MKKLIYFFFFHPMDDNTIDEKCCGNASFNQYSNKLFNNLN